MVTPDSVLPELVKLFEQQQSRLKKNRRYSEGDAQLPEMGKNVKASWMAFQKKARTNYAGLTCSSLASRITPSGVRIGDGSNADVNIVKRIWRDNRLDSVFADAIWNMLTIGVGYLLVGSGKNGEPIITSEDPLQMITIPDPVQRWRSKAAMKVWRVGDKDLATVWVPGMVQTFVRKSDSENESFVASSELLVFEGGIPVHVMFNFREQAEFEQHIDVIDRINLGKLQRLVTTAMQAFKQRAIKGDLPKEDEDGNALDWAKTFEPAPGALWELPGQLDVWESKETDIRPMLEGEKADAREYAAVTQTPVDVLVPDAANQSGQGALNVRQGEIGKAKKRISIIKPVFEAALLDALWIAGSEIAETLEVTFAPAEHVSFIEKAQAAKLAVDAGQPAEWIDKHIWGLSPDEVAENTRLRALQVLDLFTGDEQ